MDRQRGNASEKSRARTRSLARRSPNGTENAKENISATSAPRRLVMEDPLIALDNLAERNRLARLRQEREKTRREEQLKTREAGFEVHFSGANADRTEQKRVEQAKAEHEKQLRLLKKRCMCVCVCVSKLAPPSDIGFGIVGIGLIGLV